MASKNPRRLSSGRWSARYKDAHGRDREKSFPTKTEAERFLTKTRHEQHTGDWIDPDAGRVALATWAEEWLEARRSELSPGTHTRYSTIVRHNVAPLLGGSHVGSIRPVDVQQAVNSLSETLAPKTVQQVLLVLRMCLSGAVANGMIRRNPVDAVTPPRAPEQEMTHLTPEEVERICAAAPTWAPLFRFLAYTGVRLGEARGLRVGRLEPLKSPMPVHIAVQTDRWGRDDETKGRRARTIFVSGAVEEDLRERILGRGPQDRVWTTHTGGCLHHSTPRERLQRATAEAGIDRHVRLHDLRHTCASMLIERGASVVRVSRWLGHKSVTETLDTYAHCFPEDLEECVNLLWQEPAGDEKVAT